jgi:hypothetical protein
MGSDQWDLVLRNAVEKSEQTRLTQRIDALWLMDAAAYQDFVLEIVRRTGKEAGFEVLPKRWVVERTFGWMTRWRRLVRDYEQRLDVSEAMIHVSHGSLMLRRIAPIGILNRTLSSTLYVFGQVQVQKRLLFAM